MPAWRDVHEARGPRRAACRRGPGRRRTAPPEKREDADDAQLRAARSAWRPEPRRRRGRRGRAPSCARRSISGRRRPVAALDEVEVVGRRRRRCRSRPPTSARACPGSRRPWRVEPHEHAADHGAASLARQACARTRSDRPARAARRSAAPVTMRSVVAPGRVDQVVEGVADRADEQQDAEHHPDAEHHAEARSAGRGACGRAAGGGPGRRRTAASADPSGAGRGAAGSPRRSSTSGGSSVAKKSMTRCGRAARRPRRRRVPSRRKTTRSAIAAADGIVRDHHDRVALVAVELPEQARGPARPPRESRLPVGSSASSSSGASSSARAIETRCCSPPESSRGQMVGAIAEPDPREQVARRGRASSRVERAGDQRRAAARSRRRSATGAG